MVKYARIDHGKVVEVMEISSNDNVSDLYHPDVVSTLVRLSADEVIEIGWVHDPESKKFGPQELPPAGMVAKPPMSGRDFRMRFTIDERKSLTLAASRAMEAGDATLQVFIDDLSSVPLVELDHPEIIEGVNAIVAAGLISRQRADEILTP